MFTVPFIFWSYYCVNIIEFSKYENKLNFYHKITSDSLTINYINGRIKYVNVISVTKIDYIFSYEQSAARMLTPAAFPMCEKNIIYN